MINEELKELTENNAVAFATVDENGNPHCIAVGDVKVDSEERILIGDNYMSATVKNISRNSNVSLLVWNSNWQENCVGYEMLGTAKYHQNDEFHKKIKEIHKGCPAKGAIVVTIYKIKKLA
jgi:predicted pyridoxine 5'-phosphate oxidase superfamily flavin-nucleotide-binding protein